MTYRLAFIVDTSDNTLEFIPGNKFTFESVTDAAEHKSAALEWIVKNYGANLSLSDIYIVPSIEFELDIETSRV